jgi:hypothetical protein
MDLLRVIRSRVEVLALVGLFVLGLPAIARAHAPSPAPEPSSLTTFAVFAVVVGGLLAWRGVANRMRSKG